MIKVVRLDKRQYAGAKYNNMFEINNELAKAKKMLTLDYIPQRYALRRKLIEECNKANIIPEVSHKDIKRLEKPIKCQVPINVMDILEVIVKEIIKNKDNFHYRASDDYIVSLHMIYNTIESINDFYHWLEAHPNSERAECEKYREEVNYIKAKIKEFDSKYTCI